MIVRRQLLKHSRTLIVVRERILTDVSMSSFMVSPHRVGWDAESKSLVLALLASPFGYALLSSEGSPHRCVLPTSVSASLGLFPEFNDFRSLKNPAEVIYSQVIQSHYHRQSANQFRYQPCFTSCIGSLLLMRRSPSRRCSVMW